MSKYHEISYEDRRVLCRCQVCGKMFVPKKGSRTRGVGMLHRYTDQQLLEELENRKKLREVARPKVVEDPDWSSVIADGERLVELASGIGVADRVSDFVQEYLLRDVMDALFGDRNVFWAYVDACRKLGGNREE